MKTAHSDRREPTAAGDRLNTPDWVAADMVSYFKPTGKILEPCRGGGAFMRFLPRGTSWCEIDDGRDFFDWKKKVDWIITNPPYSKLRLFLNHCFDVSDNVAVIAPVRNIFSAYGGVRAPVERGLNMRDIRWYGTGSLVKFPMGNAIAAVCWRRGRGGTIKETFYQDEKR